jgi:hypothetical protein
MARDAPILIIIMAETAIDSFMKKAAATATTATTMLDLVCPVNDDMRSFFKLLRVPPSPFCTKKPPIEAAPSTSNDDTTTNNNNAGNIIHVARYGKIYKRKASSSVQGLKFKCTATTRYCKLCDAHKPLDAFYTSSKRFVCKRCHYERVNSYRYARYLENDDELRAETVWDNCLSSRIWFGYEKLRFDLTSIKDIIVGAKIPWELRPHACPIDPSLPMRPRNVAILSYTAYSLLLKVWKHTCSRGTYIGLVQRSNMVPRNFDIAFPSTPFHNPDYLRPIIDVGPILLEEQSNAVTAMETIDHSFMQHLREFKVAKVSAPSSSSTPPIIVV